MKKIPLTQGKFALIDDSDYELISRFTWSFSKDGYAISCKAGPMHRFILNAPMGSYVDHKNHDTLDNRRENIRICTASENRMNERKNNPLVTGEKFHQPQVRISHEMAEEINKLRKTLEFKVSMAAFVESLIRKGIDASK